MNEHHRSSRRSFAGSVVAGLVATEALAQIQPPAREPPSGAPGRAGGRGGGRGGGFQPPEPIDYNNHEGWQSLFDGTSLKGWDGNPEVWKVADGAIVAESTPERRVATTYLIWQGGEPGDLELKAEYKLEGPAINSGIQYRSWLHSASTAGGGGRGPAPQIPANPKWNLWGYQFDFDGVNRFTGNLYDQGTGRGEVAWRGGIVRTEKGQRPRMIASLGNAEDLSGHIKINDWNQIHLVARGNQLTHIINGQTMIVMIEDDASMAKTKGLIALQVENIGKVSFRNLWLKIYG
jgi:hypothetical protein